MFDRANVVLACSSRFYPVAAEIAAQLAAAGVTVYTPRFDRSEEERAVSPQEKFSLTLEFLQKIDASDVLYIVNPGGYVGMSVAIESGYAYAKGKRIFAMDRPSEPAIEALLVKILEPTEVSALC